MTRHLKSVNEQAEVDSAAIPPEFARCRTFGHAWDFTTVTKKGNELIQGLRCMRCETERFTTINARTGDSQGNSYSYAEGYQRKGMGAMTPRERSALRLAEVKRHMGAVQRHLRKQGKA